MARQFNVELQELRNRVLTMGGLVEQQFADALRALREDSSDLGELVNAGDDQINAMEVAIDEDCSRILIRRQPAATELRMLLAIIKAITDLERMGDEAARIGRIVVAGVAEERPPPALMHGILQLGEHVGQMLHDTLDAFARIDMDAAFDIARRDQVADAQYELLLRQLMALMMEDPRMISPALGALWVARACERVGDHARNICEYVIYLVGGRDVRHTNLELVRRQVKS